MNSRKTDNDGSQNNDLNNIEIINNIYQILLKKEYAIAIFTSDGVIKYSSNEGKDFFGFPQKELNSIDLYSLIHPADLPIINSGIDEIFNYPGKPFSCTIRFKDKSKIWCWIDITATNMLHDPKTNGIVVLAHDVTHNYNNSLKYQKDYHLIRKMVDQSLDVLCVFNEAGEFLYVSRSSEKIWGYKPDDLIGKPYMDLIIKKDRPKTSKATDELSAGYDLKNFENNYLHKNGTIVQMSWTAHFDMDEKKIFGVGRDVTGKIEIDKTLKKREKRFRTLIQNSTDGLILLDIKGNILEVSDSGKRILNYKAKTGNTKFRANIHKEDVHQINEAFFDVVNDPKNIKQIEYRYKLPDGKYKWIDATFQNQLHESSINAIVLNFRDITGRKLSDLAIARSEELRRSIMNSSLDAIICVNGEGEIVIWNKQAERTFGWERNEVLGRKLENLIFPQQYLKFYQDGIKNFSITGEGDFINNLVEISALNRKKEEFPVELTIIPVRQDDETIFCAFIRDITERKRNEEEREELTIKAEKRAEELAVSNAELEQFAYIASHDLQEPLRMITSFLTQLERKYKDQLDERAQQYIYFATDGATRMRRIILDLLEYSRVGRKEYVTEELDMNLMLEEIIKLHQPAIREKNATITWDQLPIIQAAKTPIEQVFNNLITNALKYQLPNVTPEIKIMAEDKIKYWEFSVKDNGIGIEPQYFDKIFVLFQRLHHREQYSGTGIGLAICKKIIENFKGRIWVESKYGKGSTFHFTIKK